MGRVRKIVGILLEIWGGVRLVVDLLSSLDATKDYARYACMQLATAPVSRTLTVTVIVVGLVLLLFEPVQRLIHPKPETRSPPKTSPANEVIPPHLGEPYFSLECPGEVHSHVPFDLFIRNCGQRFARNIRFDAIESRHGLKLWFSGVANLGPKERVRLGFKVGEDRDQLGVSGHVVNFFEGGSSAEDQPPYPITVRFLDGSTERTEQHMIEGHPLPKGGVRLEIYPALDEKQKLKMAREAIGKVMEQLAQCERDAYDGSNALDYDRLLARIRQIKHSVHQTAIWYLDSSFESRFLAVNVLDVQLDDATRLHFASRAQGSFWTAYQQIKGWRACLSQILQELSALQRV
jgi:hypothetical protein